MTLRPLTVFDAEILNKIRETDFADGWNTSMIVSAFGGGRFFGFVIEENGKIVSFVTAEKGVDKELDILSVYTDAKFRRKGYAKLLIEKVFEIVKIENLEKIFLEVKENNQSAINLYSGFGFKQISLRKKYYADGENAVIMIWENKNS